MSLLLPFSFLVPFCAFCGCCSGFLAQVHAQQEIGVRLALGGSPRTVLTGVIRETLLVAASGVIIGGAAAWGVARLLRHLLFGVTSHDAIAVVVKSAALAVTPSGASQLL